MKVFNLACGHDHRFEGWFASADEYDRQLSKAMIECPMCGDKSIRRLPAAPRLNLSSNHQEEQGPARVPDKAHEAQAMWMKMARHIVESTDDVGERFPEEARRIHHAQTPQRGIRGVASREQAAELAEEGIEVFSFPFPKAMKEPLQ